MNIQIFGTRKNAESRKAERYFKERRIPFQFVDMKEKGMSKGEFQSVLNAVGGLEKMLNPQCKNRELYLLLEHLVPEDRVEKVLEYQELISLPVVRNGKKATIGYAPDIWKEWE